MNSLFLAKLRRATLLLCALLGTALAACSKGPVSVSIHGVNYSNEPFSYVVIDPGNPKNTGGGELIDSYSAGGTMCCYELAPKWQPGLKVKINSKYWVGKLDDKTLKEIPMQTLIDLPRYVGEKPGELWVLRGANGVMEVVISDFEPDHQNWPGSVKGWPVPSVEFQRKVWDLYIKEARNGVSLYERLIERFKKNPDQGAQMDWDTSEKHDRESLKEFAGPHDPKFRAKLVHEYIEGLERERAELLRLQQGRP